MTGNLLDASQERDFDLTRHIISRVFLGAAVGIPPWIAFSLIPAPARMLSWQLGAQCTTSAAGVVILLSAIRPALWSEIDKTPPAAAAALLLGGISALLAVFAWLYWCLSALGDAFNQPLERVDAAYFTLTVFTTTGFGDLYASNSAARLVVTIQMAVGLVILAGLLARVVSGWAKGG